MQIYDGKKREIKRKSDKRKSLCILIFEQITLTREGVFKQETRLLTKNIL